MLCTTGLRCLWNCGLINSCSERNCLVARPIACTSFRMTSLACKATCSKILPKSLPHCQKTSTLWQYQIQMVGRCNTVKDEAKVKWSKPRPLKKQWPRGYNQKWNGRVLSVVQANRAVIRTPMRWPSVLSNQHFQAAKTQWCNEANVSRPRALPKQSL